MRRFDLIIIGSGSGNSLVDHRFADWDVAIVEKGIGPNGAYGGTCLNVGCIPTKMFVHPAHLADSPPHAARLGVDLTLDGVRWLDIRDRIFGRIDAIAAGGRRYRRDDNAGVTLFEGVGRFTGVKQVTVDTDEGQETITAEQVVVAAGSRPVVPAVPGLDVVGYHTSDTIMRLDEVPRRLVVLGAGFIAAELAHVFSAFGATVTMIGRSSLALRHEDADIARRFTDIAGERWDLRLQHTLAAAELDGDLIRLHLRAPGGTETVTADTLLVATGRVPNSDLVDAAAGGLELHDGGRIKVDATQATSVDGVWALGDVSSPWQLKHVANHEARVVQHNLLHPDDKAQTDHRFVPHAVFTAPPIGSVGLTEEEARRRGVRYVTATQAYAGVAYGWAMEDRTGFVKVLADPDGGQLLGAHIIGPEAPSLLQPLVQAMHFGLDATSMARGQYWIHPAMPEVVENALLNLPLP